MFTQTSSGIPAATPHESEDEVALSSAGYALGEGLRQFARVTTPFDAARLVFELFPLAKYQIDLPKGSPNILLELVEIAIFEPIGSWRYDSKELPDLPEGHYQSFTFAKGGNSRTVGRLRGPRGIDKYELSVIDQDGKTCAPEIYTPFLAQFLFRILDQKRLHEAAQRVRPSAMNISEFAPDIVARADRMADFYKVYYTVENTIRRMIADRLSAEYGSQWWQKIPDSIQKAVKTRQDRERDSVMYRGDDPLLYANFGELISIMKSSWDCFSDVVRGQGALEDTLTQINKVRNIIAHSCELSQNDIDRFKVLVKDWLNIQLS